MIKCFDTGTIIVIIFTVLLFTVALFVKGFTNALLLQAGVLLVSIKLIIMTYRNSVNYIDLKKELTEISWLLEVKSQNTNK